MWARLLCTLCNQGKSQKDLWLSSLSVRFCRWQRGCHQSWQKPTKLYDALFPKGNQGEEARWWTRASHDGYGGDYRTSLDSNVKQCVLYHVNISCGYPNIYIIIYPYILLLYLQAKCTFVHTYIQVRYLQSNGEWYLLFAHCCVMWYHESAVAVLQCWRSKGHDSPFVELESHFIMQWRWKTWEHWPQIKGQSSPGIRQSGQQPS